MNGDRRPKSEVRNYARKWIGSVLLLGAITIPARAQESGIEVGKAAPGAKLEMLDGKPGDLSAYIGKSPIVMEFWATWCPNCKEIEPAMLAVQKKYAGKVQFIGVAVSVNESPELVRRYVEKHGLAGVQFYDRKGTALDAYDVPATSFVVVINKAGKVVYTGLGGTQDLDAAIKKGL
ncbi:MAG TPA: TlpA disulfide reductase family protein [Gemmatimonadaceae bacterium]|jgi:thiol-disulfide isomerase/thioredoxin|nr:TlpA disulfide reductase family protein [Gemmatimonadaceae bacterium]